MPWASNKVEPIDKPINRHNSLTFNNTYGIRETLNNIFALPTRQKKSKFNYALYQVMLYG